MTKNVEKTLLGGFWLVSSNFGPFLGGVVPLSGHKYGFENYCVALGRPQLFNFRFLFKLYAFKADFRAISSQNEVRVGQVPPY